MTRFDTIVSLIAMLVLGWVALEQSAKVTELQKQLRQMEVINVR